MSDSGRFILDVTWDVPFEMPFEMPRYIGPFASAAEAREFAHLNVPNGTSMVAELSYPYLRPECICYSTRSSRCLAHSDPDVTPKEEQ